MHYAGQGRARCETEGIEGDDWMCLSPMASSTTASGERERGQNLLGS